MKYLSFILFAFVFHACTSERPKGFKEVHEGLYYRLQTIGEQASDMTPGQYLDANISVVELPGRDTIFTAPAGVTFQLKGKTGFDEIFTRFQADDSITIIHRADPDGEGTNSLDVFFDLDTIPESELNIRITRKREADQYHNDSLAYLSRGKMNEQLLLKHYLAANQLRPADAKKGIFFIPLKVNPQGRKPMRGQFIRVEYTGRMLDGRVFDATGRWKDPFVVEFGKPAQLIPGLEIAISWMNEGDEAKIILPSQLAFGDIGSAGTIPPYATVVYELRLAEIY